MTTKKRLLLVEDEEHLRNVISLNLDLEGYNVTMAASGEEAISLFGKHTYDFVLLDVMLPEIDGYAVCQHIRLKDQTVPIMFLSARSSTEERKKGLKLGADDYLAKPFDLEELLLRVKRLLYRNNRGEETDVPNEVTIGSATVNFNQFSLRNNETGEQRELTQKEVLFLKLMLTKANQAVNRNEILEVVWGSENLPSTRTVDNFIVQFRKDFEPDPKNPKYFKSIHGVGYRLVWEPGNPTS